LAVIPRESGVPSNHRRMKFLNTLEYWITRFRG